MVSLNCHSVEILGKTQTGLFPISGHSRTTKLDKRNTWTSKIFDDDVMSANFDVTVFFPNDGQFAAIQKPHSGGMVYKNYIFINSNL